MISKELSVIFPIYNEQETIKKTLLEWRDTLDKLQINLKLFWLKMVVQIIQKTY